MRATCIRNPYQRDCGHPNGSKLPKREKAERRAVRKADRRIGNAACHGE